MKRLSNQWFYKITYTTPTNTIGYYYLIMLIPKRHCTFFLYKNFLSLLPSNFVVLTDWALTLSNDFLYSSNAMLYVTLYFTILSSFLFNFRPTATTVMHVCNTFRCARTNLSLNTTRPITLTSNNFEEPIPCWKSTIRKLYQHFSRCVSFKKILHYSDDMI